MFFPSAYLILLLSYNLGVQALNLFLFLQQRNPSFFEHSSFVRTWVLPSCTFLFLQFVGCFVLLMKGKVFITSFNGTIMLKKLRFGLRDPDVHSESRCDEDIYRILEAIEMNF